MSGTPGTRLPVPGFSDSLGSRVIVRGAGGAVEVLRVAPAMASDPLFESAVREGIGRLASFAHASCGRVRRIERSPDGSGAFTLHSDYVEGNRLAEMLLIAEHQHLQINTSAVLDILRQVVSVVAGLHDHVIGGFHGLLGPDRIVIRPDAKVVIVEHVFGPALRRMPERAPVELWKDWRVAAPSDTGLPRFGPLTDLVEIGAIGVALLTGRLLRPGEYPGRLRELLDAATESDLVGSRRQLSNQLRGWIEAMLQLDPERRFRTMGEARQCLDALLSDESQYIAASIALDMLLRPRHHRIRVVRQRPGALASATGPDGVGAAGPGLPPRDREPVAEPAQSSRAVTAPGDDALAPGGSTPVVSSGGLETVPVSAESLVVAEPMLFAAEVAGATDGPTAAAEPVETVEVLADVPGWSEAQDALRATPELAEAARIVPAAPVFSEAAEAVSVDAGWGARAAVAPLAVEPSETPEAHSVERAWHDSDGEPAAPATEVGAALDVEAGAGTALDVRSSIVESDVKGFDGARRVAPVQPESAADQATFGSLGRPVSAPSALPADGSDSEAGVVEVGSPADGSDSEAGDAEAEMPADGVLHASVLDDLLGRPLLCDDVPPPSELLLGTDEVPPLVGADERLVREPVSDRLPAVEFGVAFDGGFSDADRPDGAGDGAESVEDAGTGVPAPGRDGAAGPPRSASGDQELETTPPASGQRPFAGVAEQPTEAPAEPPQPWSPPIAPAVQPITATVQPVAAPASDVGNADRVLRWARQVEADIESAEPSPTFRPAAARIRSRTTAASRRARAAPSRRGVTVAVLLAVVLAGAAGGAFWWQSRAGASATGTLVVTSEPAGTDVRIDGEARGQTPLKIELPPGRHRVEVRGIGESKAAEVEIASGQSVSQTFSFDLASLSGSLAVTSRVAGVEVYVDGQHRGTAPLTIPDLPLGIHSVTLRGPRKETQHEVTVEAAKTATLDAAETGWVRIQSPMDLQVLEKGLVIGTVNGGPIALSPGVHRLDFANVEVAYRSSQVVQVAAGETTRIAIELPMGSVNLNSMPPSEVWIDGVRIGDTPVANLSMPLGPHEVAFRHPRLGEMRYGFTVTLASPVRMSVDFKK